MHVFAVLLCYKSYSIANLIVAAFMFSAVQEVWDPGE